MDLFTFCANQGPLQEKPDLVHAIFSQVCAGLATLHNRDILHGDVKTENVLVLKAAAGRPFFCLSDLGSAHNVKAPDTFKEHGHTTAFAAPEVVCAVRSLIGKKADVFSLGCMLTDVLVAQPLFNPTASLERHLALVQRLNLHKPFPAAVRSARHLFDRDGYVRGWLPANIRLQQPWYEQNPHEKSFRPFLPFIRRCCLPSPRSRPSLRELVAFTVGLTMGKQLVSSAPPSPEPQPRPQHYSSPTKMRYSR